MFNDTPISAYLLCYGPLAVTVIGFIIFAVVTDGNARRTYLRRDPSLPAGETVPITGVVNAETPSGARVTIRPPLPDEIEVVEATVAPTALADSPVPSVPDTLSNGDNLAPPPPPVSASDEEVS